MHWDLPVKRLITGVVADVPLNQFPLLINQHPHRAGALFLMTEAFCCGVTWAVIRWPDLAAAGMWFLIETARRSPAGLHHLLQTILYWITWQACSLTNELRIEGHFTFTNGRAALNHYGSKKLAPFQLSTHRIEYRCLRQTQKWLNMI